MDEATTVLTWLDKIFLFCAILGGMAFLARMVMMFIGMGDHDAGVDAHDIGDHGDAGHGDSDASFKLLSFQGLTAFFMMFGLVGLASHMQSGLAAAVSILAASIAGIFSMYLIARMFAMMTRLQSTGTMDINQAIGEEGTVYLTIPPDGTGKVTVPVQNRLQEFEAITRGSEPLKTGERIKVVWVEPSDVLVVEKI